LFLNKKLTYLSKILMIPVFDYSLIDARVRLQDVPRLQKLVKKDSGAAKRDEQAG
jgi:hypothetical protein